ncbi:MAG: D-alanyl-D-alanine carboxypeptidase family protein [Clostridia bacterium]|nr:D-alanyl-D-alanine carboxypeptidase family protein [Clostridia bacterium]
MKKVLLALFLITTAVLMGCSKITFDPVQIIDQQTFATAGPRFTSAPTPDPTPTPEPTPEPTPVPTETPIVTTTYKSCAKILYVRDKPDARNSTVVYKLKYEEKVELIGDVGNGFSSIMFEGRVCYCSTKYLVPADETLYGYLELTDNGQKVYVVDVRLFIPDIEVFQIFATDNNICHVPLYENPVPVLRMETVKKLKMAAEKFAADGYRIKLYDAYRPKSVQFKLFDVIQISAYISNPYNGKASNHNRAAAVDITLVDSDGNELAFPTPMHTFEKISYRSSRDKWTEEQRNNVDYMTDVMTSCGFTTITSEWWHFGDSDAKSFMVLAYNERTSDGSEVERYYEMDPIGIPRRTKAQLQFIIDLFYGG